MDPNYLQSLKAGEREREREERERERETACYLESVLKMLLVRIGFCTTKSLMFCMLSIACPNV